ncbi:MAG: GNAT family N-acetyltransferase [Bacilli bacterium]|nr:GNAT family N-acetyltransferase [Bacilli bacterium]
MNNYICKIATLKDMNIKWDYEIDHADDKDNWIIWKEKAIKCMKYGAQIPYYGYLDNKIICEATASLTPDIVQNGEGLVDDETAYLTAFRTIDEYQGKGYFSRLFKYMINDLKKRGYKRVTLGVEPSEVKNKAIYTKFGFTTKVKEGIETYPDGTEIEVEYYSKDI